MLLWMTMIILLVVRSVGLDYKIQVIDCVHVFYDNGNTWFIMIYEWIHKDMSHIFGFLIMNIRFSLMLWLANRYMVMNWISLVLCSFFIHFQIIVNCLTSVCTSPFILMHFIIQLMRALIFLYLKKFPSPFIDMFEQKLICWKMTKIK